MLKAAAVYFLQVFAAGFLLGMVRVPVLVPRLGVRASELLEMPLMVLVILWASRYLVRSNSTLSRRRRLCAGLLALMTMIAAELLLAFLLSGQTPIEVVLSRDPISGSAYLLALVLFAVAPALWRSRPTGRRG